VVVAYYITTTASVWMTERNRQDHKEDNQCPEQDLNGVASQSQDKWFNAMLFDSDVVYKEHTTGQRLRKFVSCKSS
jgi:hypothetical protein